MNEKDTIHQQQFSRAMRAIEDILCKSNLDDNWICSLCMYMAWKTSTDLDKENTFMENAEMFLKAAKKLEKESNEMD